MMTPNTPASETQTNPLSVEEQAIRDELHQLFDAGSEDVPAEFIARVRSTICWRADDPASVERMLYFAAGDPFLKRESDQITSEFEWNQRGTG